MILKSVSHCFVCVNNLAHIMFPRLQTKLFPGGRITQGRQNLEGAYSQNVRRFEFLPRHKLASVSRFNVFDPKHCDAPAAALSTHCSSTLTVALQDLSFGLGSRLSRCDVTRWQHSCHLDMLMTSFCGHTVSQINALLSCAVNKKTKQKTRECLRKEESRTVSVYMSYL